MTRRELGYCRDDLGEYRKCLLCEMWGWSATHTCPPAWYVAEVGEGYEDDENELFWERIYARIPEDAVERYAAVVMQDVYDEAEGIFCVKDLTGDVQQRYRVSVVMTPCYTTEEMVEEDDD